MPDIQPIPIKRHLEADLAICEAASAGPWQANPEQWPGNNNLQYWVDGYHFEGAKPDGGVACLHFRDAQFIAAAREGWPHAIDRAIAAEKRLPDPVELPADVEESINICLNKGGMSPIMIIANMESVSRRDYHTEVLDALTVIRGFASHKISGGQDLLNALANWYWYDVRDGRWVKRKI